MIHVEIENRKDEGFKPINSNVGGVVVYCTGNIYDRKHIRIDDFEGVGNNYKERKDTAIIISNGDKRFEFTNIDELTVKLSATTPVMYKILMFVKCYKGKDRHIEDVVYKTTTVIDNLETAKSIFKRYESELNSYKYLGSYFGKCELFIPEVTEYGEAMDFSNKQEDYIQVAKLNRD